jgi:hypothetical protein
MDREVIWSSEKNDDSMIVVRDGILTFGYLLPRQAPVHNPYFLYIYIYPYPMSLTSIQDRVDCYAIGLR